MDKAFVAKRVVSKLHATEKTVDSAILEVSELVSELITARREVGLSTTVGDKELAAVIEALAALNTARASLVTSHKGLGRIAKALHIPVKMNGGSKPEINEEGDQDALRMAS
jgi:hypothetical protein